ncbi:hypothetical protein GCM10007886_07830 [Methylobacterium gregans]|nr:hypothetical protein GCM10007886_07830 [Methylobacterium gregans]
MRGSERAEKGSAVAAMASLIRTVLIPHPNPLPHGRGGGPWFEFEPTSAELSTRPEPDARIQ